MDAEEINGLLWETLARMGRPACPEDLSLESGQPLTAVQSGLARLRQAGLVESVPSEGPGAQRAVVELDALRWAQAVGMGVGLLALERHAHLSKMARAQALRMTTDGSLEKVEAAARSTKRKVREAAIHGRAASRAAATDLAQILKDTQAACDRTARSRPGSPRERAVAQLLEQAHREAQKALGDLVKSLSSR